MGRPIKSKFFGNTNSGTTSSSDDKIGGEGVASLSISNFGQFLIQHMNLPMVHLPNGPLVPRYKTIV